MNSNLPVRRNSDLPSSTKDNLSPSALGLSALALNKSLSEKTQLAIVIDQSESMRNVVTEVNEYIKNIREIILKIQTEIKREVQTELATVGYVGVETPLDVAGFCDIKSADSTREISCKDGSSGNEDLYKALEKLKELNWQKNSSKAVIWFGDVNGNLTSQYYHNQKQNIQELKNQGVKIYGFHLNTKNVYGDFGDDMKSWCRETGGRYFAKFDSKKLREVVTAIFIHTSELSKELGKSQDKLIQESLKEVKLLSAATEAGNFKKSLLGRFLPKFL